MNRYKLTKAGINPNQGIARFNGKADLYEQVLNKFPKDDHYPKMVQALAQKNVEDAFQNAHALKGMVGNMSMTELYEAVVPLVEELRVGSLEHSEELLAVVSEKYEKIIEAIAPKTET